MSLEEILKLIESVHASRKDNSDQIDGFIEAKNLIVELIKEKTKEAK